MKHKIYPLLILFLIFSCENSFSPELEEIDLESGSLNSQLPDLDFTNPVVIAAFENQMQWISFLTAKTILQDESAKQDFLQAIQDYGFVHNGRTTLNLRDLIKYIPDAELNDDGNSRLAAKSSLDYEQFNILFKKIFHQYQGGEDTNCSQSSRTTGIGGEPRPIKPAGGTNDDHQLSLYYQFISEITQQQCLQLYLPFGLDEESMAIRSSAHPLNDELINTSYEHETTQCQVRIGTISNLDGIDTPNLIITRPYRFGLGHGCTYFDFDFNFENFMNVNN